MMQSETQFSFHLDGSNEIDASLLAKIINDFAAITEYTSNNINKDAYLKMKVTAFRNGSFEIDFSAIIELASTLIIAAPAAITFAETVVDTVKGYLEIKKLLKGKSPKKVTELPDHMTRIENLEGQSIVVPKQSADIIKNTYIDKHVTNISYYVVEHNPEGGFSFDTPSGKLYCSKNDVKNIGQPLPIVESELIKRGRANVALHIKKPDLLGRSQWEFRYNYKDSTQNISATIEDDDFLNKVRSGEYTIKASDYINVLLEVETKLDEQQRPVNGSEKYRVLKVIGPIMHEENHEQLKL